MSAGGFVGTKLFVVPAGTPTLYRGEWKPSGRKQVIDLTKPGCVANRYGDDWLNVTWPGTGGYWRDVYQYRGEFVARSPSSDWAYR
jgi:hypothetical protein